jgi:integrase
MARISEKIVEALPVPETGNKLHYFSGGEVQGKKAPSGFAVRVTAAGSKAFVWFHRVNGKGHLETIGSWRGNETGGDLSVLGAIEKAAARAQEVSKGFTGKGKDVKEVDPLPERTRRRINARLPAERNISGLIDMFIERHVEKNLRSHKNVTQTLERLVKPTIGHFSIYAIKRSHISQMLDDIADTCGEVMADRTLAYLRKAFNWYAIRGHDDDFTSPIVQGMTRTNPAERARDRVLTDDEIRALWGVTGDTPFGLLMRFILLTATRKNEAARMTFDEIGSNTRDWTIPAKRYKTKRDHVVPLSDAALDVIKATGRTKGLVFTNWRELAISNWNKFKIDLDEKSGVTDWTIHDLRRTARSLMSRAKVPTDHAERCLGHVIGGVRGTYDRYAYLDEKRAAFKTLASVVDSIINPRPSNVVDIHKKELQHS